MRAAPASGTKRRSSWSPPSAMLLRPARGPQLAGGALRRGHDLTVGDLLKERGASTVIEVGVEALVLFVLDAVVLVAQPIVDGHSHGVPMKPSSAGRPTPCSDNCGRIDGRSDGPGSRRRSGCSAIGIQCAGPCPGDRWRPRSTCSVSLNMPCRPGCKPLCRYSTAPPDPKQGDRIWGSELNCSLRCGLIDPAHRVLRCTRRHALSLAIVPWRPWSGELGDIVSGRVRLTLFECSMRKEIARFVSGLMQSSTLG
jgi:hypothetical protein